MPDSDKYSRKKNSQGKEDRKCQWSGDDGGLIKKGFTEVT